MKSLDQAILDAIAEALAYQAAPPPNEAATCLWVIYPLLRALGYAPQEIQPQGSDHNGQYPDYAILPATAHSWFLEAKSWQIALQDSHAHQALNYANHNGRRWVVLCNGRVWRLYDNQVQGVAAAKLVAEVQLDDVSAAQALLGALAKDSVTLGELEAYAKRTRVIGLLARELADPNSGCISLLRKRIASELGLPGITGLDVIEALKSELPSTTSPPPTGTATPKPSTPTPTAPVVPSNPQRVGLDQLQLNPADATGKLPTDLCFPDGSSIMVDSWRAVATGILSWLFESGVTVKLPYRGGSGGKRYFINDTPHHQHRAMRAHSALTMSGQQVFVDTQRSAVDLLRHAAEVCVDAGVDCQRVKVGLS